MSVDLLIVEDNPLIQISLKETLNKFGFQADIASNGEEALVLYNPNYQLILMDLDLPDIDGITITEIIREAEENTTHYVPIIAITSHYNEPEYQEKCLKAGMNGFYGKLNANQLRCLIEEYVDKY